MPATQNLQSPTEMPLVTPSSDVGPSIPTESGDNNGKVQMKKQLGLIEGVAIILGIIFGSGKKRLAEYRCQIIIIIIIN